MTRYFLLTRDAWPRPVSSRSSYYPQSVDLVGNVARERPDASGCGNIYNHIAQSEAIGFSGKGLVLEIVGDDGARWWSSDCMVEISEEMFNSETFRKFNKAIYGIDRDYDDDV